MYLRISEIRGHEETSNISGLQRAQMLSIKGGSELLVYGGTVGGGPLDGIWKYRVDKVSFLPTFYEQLLRQFPCTKKLQT